MTREHIFFIPFIFALGFVTGILTTRTRGSESSSVPRPSGRGVVGSLLALVAVFAATHVFSMHGGARHVGDALHGQVIFDQRPSFDADSVYERLELFGPDGRAAYQHMTFTTDLVFPLVLLNFLIQLARYTVRSAPRASRGLAWLAVLTPVTWLLSDLAENATLYTLIADFPERHTSLAAMLGIVTYVKFALLLASLALPAGIAWRDAHSV